MAVDGRYSTFSVSLKESSGTYQAQGKIHFFYLKWYKRVSTSRYYEVPRGTSSLPQ